MAIENVRQLSGDPSALKISDELFLFRCMVGSPTLFLGRQGYSFDDALIEYLRQEKRPVRHSQENEPSSPLRNLIARLTDQKSLPIELKSDPALESMIRMTPDEYLKPLADRLQRVLRDAGYQVGELTAGPRSATPEGALTL